MVDANKIIVPTVNGHPKSGWVTPGSIYDVSVLKWGQTNYSWDSYSCWALQSQVLTTNPALAEENKNQMNSNSFFFQGPAVDFTKLVLT